MRLYPPKPQHRTQRATQRLSGGSLSVSFRFAGPCRGRMGLRGHMTATHHLWKAQGKRFFIMLVIGAYKTRRESSDM